MSFQLFSHLQTLIIQFQTYKLTIQIMIERVEFPQYLDSYKGLPPSDFEQLKFQNYYPRSQKLKKNSKIIPVNDDCQELEKQIISQMKSLTLDTLYVDGKINILPKKTTLDLKRSLSKKTLKLQKKTQKAIAFIAKDLLLKKKTQQATNNQKTDQLIKS